MTNFIREISLRLHLTSLCNLNCTYCYEDKSIKGESMSLNDFKNILEIYKDYKIKKLYLYGGEPLLNDEIINYLINLKKLPNNIESIGMTTNAILLSNKLIKYLENNNSHINISIDGIKIAHDMNRINHNKIGSFNLIMNNIKNIKDFSIFNISMTLSPITINYMFESIIFLRKKGFINFSINFLYEENWDNKSYKDLIINLKKIKFYKILNYENFYNELNYSSGLTCKNHMLDSMSIGPKLEILPCGYWWSKIIKNSGKIKITNLGYLKKDFDFKEKLESLIFKEPIIEKIMSKGRICEVLSGNNNSFINNKKKIDTIIKNNFK